MPEDFTALYKQALERLATGGKALEASLQEIEEGKRQAIARGQQALVSGGLAGTTMMAGVPLQAEKIAATQRLGARGRAEEKYLTTLASFAAFAQRGQEAAAERELAKEMFEKEQKARRREAELQYRAAIWTSGGRSRTTPTPTSYGSPIRKPGEYGALWPGYGAPRGETPTTGAGMAKQFPALYDTGPVSYPAVPDWTGMAGAVAGEVEPETGSVPYGERVAPTIEEPGEEILWRNMITGEDLWQSAEADKPTTGWAPAGWMAVERRKTKPVPSAMPGIYGAPTHIGTMFA